MSRFDLKPHLLPPPHQVFERQKLKLRTRNLAVSRSHDWGTLLTSFTSNTNLRAQ